MAFCSIYNGTAIKLWKLDGRCALKDDGVPSGWVPVAEAVCDDGDARGLIVSMWKYSSSHLGSWRGRGTVSVGR